MRRLLGLVVAAGCVLATVPGVSAALPVGCRPATGARGARACGGLTGFATAESHVVVTRDGAVVFTPAVLPHGLLGTGTAPVDVYPDTQSNAGPAGQAVSRDGGRTWQLVRPFGLTWNPTDHGDFADPTTGRLFFADYGPIPLAPGLGPEQEGPAHLMWSADDGRTWTHTAIPTVFLPENPRFAAGRPPEGQARPAGYPNVLYFCANTNVGVASPVITSRRCFRSLDGGTTFTEQATVLRSSVPVHAECGTSGESLSAIDGAYPQAAPDGTLLMMLTCAGRTYLARSSDEAATFPVVGTLPLPAAGVDAADLRVGPDGVVYLVDQEGAQLLLRTSRDGGRTWGRPRALVPGGLTGVLHWALAQAGDRVAVAFLAHHAGQTGWDGWITLVRGGRTSSGQVNPPGRPLLFGDQVQGAGTVPVGPGVPFPPPFDIQVLGNDFIGAAIGPDGTAWGSFTQDCGPSPGSPGCQERQGQTRGFAGRLVGG